MPKIMPVTFAVAITMLMASAASAQFETSSLLGTVRRANFRAPNANRSAGGFGTITQTYDPRQVQLGVKVAF